MSKNRSKPINILPKSVFAKEEKIASRYNHFIKGRESKTSMGADGTRGMINLGSGETSIPQRSPIQTFGKLPTFRETESFIYTKLLENSNCKSNNIGTEDVLTGSKFVSVQHPDQDYFF